MRKEDSWKIFCVIIGLLGITILPINLCDFTKTEIYPISSSGSFIKSIDKTIFIGSPTYSRNYPAYICNGELNEYKTFNNIDDEEDNCEFASFRQGVSNNNIIQDIKIQLNNEEIEITRKGVFCFSKK